MVPIVLLTGFLGSGKTTLLNRMIAARAFDRLALGPGKLALIVNELGEIGIDGALLPSELTRQVELPGGCICCVLNDDLERTIVELLDRSPEVTTIVIETTGVAEPLPIAWTIGREPLASRVRLAAVVTLVDATQFPAQRGLSPAVDAQVAYADAVVVTKLDLATATEAAAARAAVNELAPRAPVVGGTPDEVVAWLQQALDEPRIQRDHVHDHVHDHGNTHGIETVWVPMEGTLDLEDLCDALAGLPASYVRIKGIAWVVDGRTGRDDPHWAAIHRVGLRVSTEPLDRPGPAALVALGRGVERGPLAACVERAMLSSIRTGS